MRKLISNTAFGNSLRYRNVPDYEYRYLRDEYDSFLLQKLEIWMFVPCKLVDGVWVVLEEPKEYQDYLLPNEQYGKIPRIHDNRWHQYCKEYHEAKERCIFEGFEIGDPFKEYIMHGSDFGLAISDFNKETIEDLVKYNLTLTKEI